jgi:eukaryotic-like serine/threonine-protein kinase
MQTTEWIKIKEVFNQTLDLPRTERDGFLANYDNSVKKEVIELIKSLENADEFIVEPAAIEFGLSQDVNIGQRIDDYKIVSEIGVGGMGTVYLAERIGFEQKVAIKLIKRGMDSRAVLKRFKMERQILSRLNHPNIAKLLDGGTTPEGLPYFVMEYIEGETVTKFCENHQFDVNERLELFQKVCEAISYAHSNLIVHQDIKPSNIIVTNDGTPKLLDFGIAKLLDSDLDSTATQARMFTPEYASPEQINGLPITTATDVYSLGVVLYELLSGVRPFTSKSRNYGEIANLVLTHEPSRPSSVVLSHSRSQSVNGRTSENQGQRTKNEGLGTKFRNPQSAVRNLQGDLDNIILKALRKEPESRYQSIGEFSEDIKRHLSGLPVTATADSTRYRFTKFVQRHKQGVAISAFVSLLIFSLSGVAIYQGVAATRERARAERSLLETRKIANSLMFEIHDSLQNLPGATASRELLVKRALEYLNNSSKETADNPDLEKELAVAYRKVGDIQGGYFAKTGKSSDALENYLKAYQIQTKLFNADLLLLGRN